MLAHDWPGNVRELKQAVQSAVLFAQGELVTAEELNLMSPESLPILTLP